MDPGAGHRGTAACGFAGVAGHLLLRTLRAADHGSAGGSGTLHGAADAGSKGTRPGRWWCLGIEHGGKIGEFKPTMGKLSSKKY